MNKFLFFVLFIIINTPLLAQDFELMRVETSFYPKQSIEDSNTNGEIGFLEWSGQFAIPQRFNKNKKTLLIHKFAYSNLKVDVNTSTNMGLLENDKHYHTVSYNLGLIRIINLKWRILMNVNPIIASDLQKNINHDDFLFQGSALALYSKNKNVTYGLGAVYTNRFGRPLVIPMAMYNYKSLKMKLDIVLPNKLSIMFNTLNRTFFYGFKAQLNGGLFNNTSDLNIINTAIDEAGYSRLNIGPALSIKLKNNLKIHLTGGMAVGRRMEFIDFNDETVDRTPESGPFFNLGFTLIPQKGNN